MKGKYAVSALAALLLVPALRAQAQTTGGAAPPAAEAGTRVGLINFRQVVFGTAEGRQGMAQLDSQFAPRRTDLENLAKQITDLQNRLNAGERTLSDVEKIKLRRQGELWARQFQRRQDEAQEEFNAAQADLYDRLEPKVQEVLNKYAKENGYLIVLDFSSQSTPVVFGSPQVDLTQTVIRLYDQAYPVKAASTESAPAPPKAQPGQTRPAQKPPQQ